MFLMSFSPQFQGAAAAANSTTAGEAHPHHPGKAATATRAAPPCPRPA